MQAGPSPWRTLPSDWGSGQFADDRGSSFVSVTLASGFMSLSLEPDVGNASVASGAPRRTSVHWKCSLSAILQGIRSTAAGPGSPVHFSSCEHSDSHVCTGTKDLLRRIPDLPKQRAFSGDMGDWS